MHCWHMDVPRSLWKSSSTPLLLHVAWRQVTWNLAWASIYIGLLYLGVGNQLQNRPHIDLSGHTMSRVSRWSGNKGCLEHKSFPLFCMFFPFLCFVCFSCGHSHAPLLGMVFLNTQHSSSFWMSIAGHWRALKGIVSCPSLHYKKLLASLPPNMEENISQSHKLWASCLVPESLPKQSSSLVDLPHTATQFPQAWNGSHPVT